MTEHSNAETTMAKNIEQVLEAEEHIVRIEPAEQWDFPDVDYSKFGDVPQKRLEPLIKSLEKNLSAPYIIDDFQDHKERREWKDYIRQKHGGSAAACLEHNSLRRNIVWQMMSVIAVLNEKYSGKDSREFKAFTRRTIRGYYGNIRFYDRKTPEQKIELIKSLKKDIYAVLQKLAKQPGQDISL